MRWNYLKRGDIVDIVAPASHSPAEKLDLGLDWLTSIGLVPHFPPDLIDPDVFFAAKLETQLEHLKAAIYSDSKAIWCLRGGYGSMRLIPYLKKLRPPKRPKLFIGFSDITSLHLFFNQHWNWPTIHGRTISQLPLHLKNTPDRKELQRIIFGSLPQKTFRGLRPLNDAAKRERIIKGSIIGGNLRILQSSLGTSWQLNARRKFLFIEDVAERGYSIDRMLEQLYQAKITDKGLLGLLIGDFTGGLEKDGADLSRVALERFAARVNYPVFSGLPAGHGLQRNHAVPFNTVCELRTGRRADLTCDFGGE